MFKKTIKFVGFDGQEKERDFWFHLSNAELAVLSASADDMKSRVDRIMKAQDNVAILNELRALIKMSCGIRSEDGERFIKNEEAQSQLLDSPAFDALLFELFVGNNAVEFFKQLVPPDQAKQIEELAKQQSANPFKEPPNPEVPTYQRERRRPTDAEQRDMTREQLTEAWKWTEQNGIR